MKKVFLLFLIYLVVLIPSVNAQQLSLQNLIGKWEAPEGGGLEVMDSAHIYLTYGTDKKQVVSYSFDFSKTPAWFDFSVKDSATTIHMKSLLLFNTADEVQWQVFEDGVRPVQFSTDKGDAILILKRKR
ncbi:MAG TPA: hypothetical protein VHK91_09875 [Flavisolibacter sp.]|jgi:hypothetical protein|nr:hypothetical protein [Flavisolibacter sp.]